MHLRHVLALCLFILVAVACTTDASPVPDVETATPPPEPTVGESPPSPLPTPRPTQPRQGDSPLPQPEPGQSPLQQPEISPLATPSDAAADIVAMAREHLAGELEISSQGVELVGVETVEWSDASLGCPEPGKAYAQVITPGYRVILRVGGGEYEVHTDREGRFAVICETGP